MVATILKPVPNSLPGEPPDDPGPVVNTSAEQPDGEMAARGFPLVGRNAGSFIYAAAISVCAILLGLTSTIDPVGAIIGSTGAGALCILRRRGLAALIALILAALAALLPTSDLTMGYWLLIGLMLAACVFPVRTMPSLLRISPIAWAGCMVLTVACIQGSVIGTGQVMHLFTILGCFSSALLGAGLTRHLAMMDARILTWGEEGLGAVTRDLLLGRITSGMLHDLSQPLNVIAMANGNLAYIVEHLQVDDSARKHLLDRITRISTHTENASGILTLFRWFGRSGKQEDAVLNVRNALNRAIAATRSNVRHQGIDVDVDGNALDQLIPEQQGRLELMAVAALLSAFGGYAGQGQEKRKGCVTLFAATSPAHIVIQFRCLDEDGQPVACERLDNATLWLIEQVALEAGGDFRCLAHRGNAVQFVIRLARDDI